ncbi:hypothetical protein ACZ11_04850 [Lysinibacillus xylanilyticus]|uniref:DUF4238 domain-containing protein n=1 Tax=Lysinibacillus xylanilyticus TaxID=582475 RepID=A0A0K9FBG1_9BACI|nr:hypothetical protein ACZ11_04850 [Lysinibacillus xylanilyticus]
MYDKIQNKTYNPGLMGVSSENFFYTLSEKEINDIKKELLQDEINPNFVDDLFTYEIEPVFNNSLEKLLNSYSKLKNENEYVLLESDLSQLAFSLAFQYYRTKSFRNGMQQDFKSFISRALNAESVAEIGGFFDERIVLEHSKKIFSKSYVLAEKLANDYIWILMENNTGIPFYTSDTPVVAWVLDDGEFLQAIHEPPNEIDQYAIPRTDKLLLVLAKREEFLTEILNHRKVKSIKKVEEIEFYNVAQLHACFRQVFCISKDFAMINGLDTILPDRTAGKVKIN